MWQLKIIPKIEFFRYFSLNILISLQCIKHEIILGKKIFFLHDQFVFFYEILEVIYYFQKILHCLPLFDNFLIIFLLDTSSTNKERNM